MDRFDHFPNLNANLADYLDRQKMPDCAERVRWLCSEVERLRKIEDEALEVMSKPAGIEEAMAFRQFRSVIESNPRPERA